MASPTWRRLRSWPSACHSPPPSPPRRRPLLYFGACFGLCFGRGTRPAYCPAMGGRPLPPLGTGGRWTSLRAWRTEPISLQGRKPEGPRGPSPNSPASSGDCRHTIPSRRRAQLAALYSCSPRSLQRCSPTDGLRPLPQDALVSSDCAGRKIPLGGGWAYVGICPAPAHVRKHHNIAGGSDGSGWGCQPLCARRGPA